MSGKQTDVALRCEVGDLPLDVISVVPSTP